MVRAVNFIGSSEYTPSTMTKHPGVKYAPSRGTGVAKVKSSEIEPVGSVSARTPVGAMVRTPKRRNVDECCPRRCEMEVIV